MAYRYKMGHKGIRYLNKMKALAVIPARGGSRGIPDKNIQLLNGKPLIYWSILAARKASLIDRVAVSSDSYRILGPAVWYKADPVERPQELATDDAPTDPVILHALDYLKKLDGYEPDAVVLLQPTSPLRPDWVIDTCVDSLRTYDSVFTVHEANHFVWGRMASTNDGSGRGVPQMLNMPFYNRKPRQAIEEHERAFVENGNVYAVRTDMLRKTGSRICGKIDLVEIPKWYGIDIDTEDDLWMAERLMTRGKPDMSITIIEQKKAYV